MKSPEEKRRKPDVQKRLGELSAAYNRAFEGIELLKAGAVKEAQQAHRDAKKMLKKLESTSLPKKKAKNSL
jgi:hypothetical protein